MRMKPPDSAWLIDVISVFNPSDEIFNPNYYFFPTKPDVVIRTFDNSDGLLIGAMPLSCKEIRKTNRMRMPREEKLALKLERAKKAKLKYAELEKRIIDEINFASDSSDSYISATDNEEEKIPDKEGDSPNVSKVKGENKKKGAARGKSTTKK